jgi:hypothetical protein
MSLDLAAADEAGRLVTEPDLCPPHDEDTHTIAGVAAAPDPPEEP